MRNAKWLSTSCESPECGNSLMTGHEANSSCNQSDSQNVIAQRDAWMISDRTRNALTEIYSHNFHFCCPVRLNLWLTSVIDTLAYGCQVDI